MVEKGFVSSVESNGMAKVTIPTRGGYVTAPLVIAATAGTLIVGQTVAFVEFGDLTGVILCRLEG